MSSAGVQTGTGTLHLDVGVLAHLAADLAHDLDLQRLGIVGLGSAAVALGFAGNAAGGIGLGQIGVELDRLGEVLDGAVVVALGLPPQAALALSLAKRAREILLGLPGLLYLHFWERAGATDTRLVPP